MAKLNNKERAAVREESQLSVLAKVRIQVKSTIPDTLESGNYVPIGIKKYKVYSQLVKTKIEEQFPSLLDESHAHYFVDVQDRLLGKFQHNVRKSGDDILDQMNNKFYEDSGDREVNIGLLYLGAQTTGGNNIVDGLLRFKSQNPEKVKIVGFIEGMRGVETNNVLEITDERFKLFNNTGGYDFLGKSSEAVRNQHQLEIVKEACLKHKLTGLIMVGATHTLTDATMVSDYLLSQKIDTRVIAIPATVDGNIHHSYVATSLGFDTASKVYSQLVGNMLTDSASAIKYWYFIRLMGRDPSHLAIECALKTHPNVVLMSEECAMRNETLVDIVKRLADIIEQRATQGKNYGCVLIPEGLLNHISAYNSLLEELITLFERVEDRKQANELSTQLYNDE